MRSHISARILLVFSNALVPVFAGVIGLFATAVFAADVTSTWSTATSNNWNVNANWTNVPALGGFPNNGNSGVATYDATISPVGSPYTVTLNTNVTVEDLLLSSANATLSQTSGTLSATGAITLSAGTLQLNGGTISNTTVNVTSGTLAPAANGANLLSGVTVNGDLTLNTSSAVTKIAGGTTFNTAHLANNAVDLGYAPGQTLASTILFEGAVGGTRHVELNGTSGGFTIGATGVIRTNAGLTGDGDIGAGQNFGGAMALTNNGLISSQVSGRTITVSSTSLANSATGILEATGGGILTINSTNWTNVGNLRALTGSTANLNGAWSNLGGTITADATSTLNLGGTFSTPNLGTLSLAAGSSVNVIGAWDNSGQSFTFNAASGSWTLKGGSISGGSIGFADGKTLIIAANATNLLSGVTVNGDLTLNTSSAVTKIAGGTTFNTAHLANNAVDLGYAPGQTLASTILFEGAVGGTRHVELNGTSGSFTIGATGVIRTNAGLTGDGDIGAGQNFGGAMALTNNGLISSQVSGRTITVSSTSLANSATGIVEATGGGILTINSTNWTNVGNLRALTGSTANLNGAWSNLGGTITADATSTLNLGGTFSTPNLGTLSLAAGSSVNVIGAWDNSGQSFTFNAASGSWTLKGGSISGGSIGFADGKTLIIAANATNLLSGVTVNGDLTLNTSSAVTKIAGGTTFNTAHLANNAVDLGYAPGQTLASTILFEGAVGGTRHVELNGTSGSFTIGATGVIRTNAGLTGDGDIGAGQNFGGAMALTNNGLISSQVSGRTITVSSTSLANSATGIVEATGGGILTINSTNWTNVGNLRALTGSTANLNGAWSNLGGTITADATSTLNLGGTFSTPNLGTLSLAAGSSVNVIGAWDNSGQSFTFNAASGSWTLKGGSISGGSIGFADGKTLIIAANATNLLSGVTVNGDLTLNTSSAVTKIAGGTTFNTAHLANNAVDLGYAPGQTLASTILFEGAVGGTRHVELNGTSGSFTIGATGVIRTNAGLTGDGDIGAGQNFGGAMALTNNGLISSQVSGRTITVSSASLANSATGILEATGGGILTINSTNWTNVGNLRALTGSTANLNGAWSNLGGTITADATSTLNLGGTFSTPNLGTLSLAAGSSVNVIGAWDNSGQSFTFNAASGSWTLKGGSISGGSIGFADGKTLIIAANATNLLSGVTVNGDLTLNTSSAVTKIAGGTTFNTAHLANNAVDLGYAPGQTLASTILFEGAVGGTRHVELNGTSGSFTIGATGVIRTNAGLTGDGDIGAGQNFGGAMALTNNGLISSQVSGRTITVSSATFTNAGTLEAVNGGNLTVPLGYTQTAGITRLSGGGSISAFNGATNTITVGGGELDGVGTITANVANSATLAVSPGLSAGRLTITGDLTLGATSTLQIGIGGRHPGTDSDLLSEAGTTALNLAGALHVSLINGYMPTAADSLVIVSSNQPLSGMFSNVVGGHVTATDGITSLKVSVVGNHVVLNLLAGDYNRNGVVDAADYVLWRSSLGQSGAALAADGNGNNQVDVGDYNVWRTNFGHTAGSGSGASANAAVPEPTTLWVLLSGILAMCFRRRVTLS